MTTFYIDPSLTGRGNGTEANPYRTWAQAGTLTKGNSYLQKGGTTSGAMLIISTQATAAQPLVLGAYGTGKAKLTNALILQGCAYVHISGFEMTGHRYAGVTIQQAGTHHCEVKDCDIHGCGAGVWIGEGAGGGHRIVGNTIRANKGNGIAVDRVNLTEGNETAFANNTITDNDTHGIELSGNRYVVVHNTISGNGRVTPGTSAIHMYAGGFQGTEFFDAGSYNLIMGNVCTDQRCPTTDGNGIQCDQACHDNTIVDNLCYENDGAGIVLFDAWANTMRNNITFANARDPADSHPYRGELVLHADHDKCYGNVAQGNQFWSNDPRVPAINVTSAVDRPNDVEDNATSLTLTEDVPQPYFHSFPLGTQADGKTLKGWSPGSPGSPPPPPEPEAQEGGLAGPP